MTEATCVLVRELTCAAFSPATDKAPNWVVESEEMSLVAIAATWEVPRPASCEVLNPATWVEVIAPICAAVSEANPLVLIEPICVLVSAPTALVDSAATSEVLNPDNVEVESVEA